MQGGELDFRKKTRSRTYVAHIGPLPRVREQMTLQIRLLMESFSADAASKSFDFSVRLLMGGERGGASERLEADLAHVRAHVRTVRDQVLAQGRFLAERTAAIRLRAVKVPFS